MEEEDIPVAKDPHWRMAFLTHLNGEIVDFFAKPAPAVRRDIVGEGRNGNGQNTNLAGHFLRHLDQRGAGKGMFHIAEIGSRAEQGPSVHAGNDPANRSERAAMRSRFSCRQSAS